MQEINLSIRGFPSLVRKKNEKMKMKKKGGRELTALDNPLKCGYYVNEISLSIIGLCDIKEILGFSSKGLHVKTNR